MAKWGEGDPRWIVEERPDATNVNNWHWTEKNAGPWSQEKIKSLFVNWDIQEPGLGKVTFTEMSKCEGEATVNNRKGKLIFFYEWVLKVDWKATPEEDENKEVKGSISVPNLSEENDVDEVDVNISITSGGETAEKFKEFLRKKGTNIIQERLGEYLTSLKKEYAQDVILPTKGQAVTKSSKTIVTPSVQEFKQNTIQNTTSSLQKMDIGTKIPVTKVEIKQTFKCRAEELYNAFTVREMVVAFTRNDVKLDVQKDGKFQLFGGNIEGQFKSLTPGKQIVQSWRFKTWPSGHVSTVTLNFIEKEDATELRLTQEGVPSSDAERTKQGWTNYYFESIKRTFGFGAMLV